MKIWLNTYLKTSENAASLAAFRILFGLLMLASIIRFWAMGWIEKLYISPQMHFTFYGFEWVKPLGNFTYVLFAICALAALAVAIGYKYKVAITVFFLSFTYIELMDKTTYLNHYYFISVLSFMMIFLPASAYYSVDAAQNPDKAFQRLPRVYTDIIKLLISIVYFYAGLAKLNSDWLVHAQPLAIWLPGRYDLPFVGHLLEQTWAHYALSWGGAIYDLAIPFMLWYKPTRKLAFALVVFFHVFTRILFPIGMFPYIMMASATLFFSSSFHQSVIAFINRFVKVGMAKFNTQQTLVLNSLTKPAIGFMALILALQLALPWRHVFYPGELFWHEQGFRFSWRVMLMEKAGYADFTVVNKQTGRQITVDNEAFLTPFQIKQMSFQPDFILEYAHWLNNHYCEKWGATNLAVYAKVHVALNGRASQLFIDSTRNLTTEKRGWHNKTWILPFDDTISGI